MEAREKRERLLLLDALLICHRERGLQTIEPSRTLRLVTWRSSRKLGQYSAMESRRAGKPLRISEAGVR
jgi:hypothetical protein